MLTQVYTTCTCTTFYHKCVLNTSLAAALHSHIILWSSYTVAGMDWQTWLVNLNCWTDMYKLTLCTHMHTCRVDANYWHPSDIVQSKRQMQLWQHVQTFSSPYVRFSWCTTLSTLKIIRWQPMFPDHRSNPAIAYDILCKKIIIWSRLCFSIDYPHIHMHLITETSLTHGQQSRDELVSNIVTNTTHF